MSKRWSLIRSLRYEIYEREQFAPPLYVFYQNDSANLKVNGRALVPRSDLRYPSSKSPPREGTCLAPTRTGPKGIGHEKPPRPHFWRFSSAPPSGLNFYANVFCVFWRNRSRWKKQEKKYGLYIKLKADGFLRQPSMQRIRRIACAKVVFN